MMGIESKIANYVQKLREVEVAFSKKTRNVNVAIFSCSMYNVLQGTRGGQPNS